jgi:hypothetical protein
MKWVVKIFTIIFIFASVLLVGSCVQKVDEPKVEEITTSLADVPLRAPVFKDEGNFALKSIENVDTNNFTATLVYDASSAPNVVKGGVLQLKVDPNDPYSYELLKVVDIKTNGNEIVMEVKQASLVDIFPENTHIKFEDDMVIITYVDKDGKEKTAVGPLELKDVLMIDTNGNKESIYNEVTNETQRRGLMRGKRGQIIGFTIPFNAFVGASESFSGVSGDIYGGLYGDIDITQSKLNKIEVYLKGGINYYLNTSVRGSASGVSSEKPLVVYPSGMIENIRSLLLRIAGTSSEIANIINSMSQGELLALVGQISYLKSYGVDFSVLDNWFTEMGWFTRALASQAPTEKVISFLTSLSSNIESLANLFETFSPFELEYYKPVYGFSIGGVLNIIVGIRIGVYDGMKGTWNVQSSLSFSATSSRSFKLGVGWANGFYGINEGKINFNIKDNPFANRNFSTSGNLDIKPYLSLRAGIDFYGDLFVGVAGAGVGSGGFLRLYDRYALSSTSSYSTIDVFTGISAGLYATLRWSLLWGIFSGSQYWDLAEFTLLENKVFNLPLLNSPSILNASKDYTYKVSISWNSVNGANKYYVYRFVNGEYQKIAEVSQTNYEDTNALFGTNYYSVKAYSSTYGESAYSTKVMGVRTRPMVSVAYPTNVSFVGVDMPMSATARVTNSSISSIRVVIRDTNPITNYSYIFNSSNLSTNIPIPASEIRALSIDVWAVDNYGVSSLTQTINVYGGNRDTIPPFASVTNNPTILNPYGGSIIAGTASDNFAVKEVWVDDGSGTFRKASITSNYFTNCEWVITNGSLSSGYKTVRVYAIDVSNNYSTTNGCQVIVPQVVSGVYWKGIYTNAPYSGNIVLLGVNNGNLLFSVDRYPYGSIDETRSYSLSGMPPAPPISDFEYFNYGNGYFHYFIFSVNNKLAYVSLYQGQYYFYLTTNTVRNLIGGYDGNIYYSTWVPENYVTGGDVGKLNIYPGGIGLTSFRRSDTAYEGVVGGGITLVVGSDGLGRYKVVGHVQAYYNDSRIQDLYSGYSIDKYIPSTTSETYTYLKRQYYISSISGSDLVVYGAALFGGDRVVAAYKKGNVLKVGGKSGSTVDLGTNSFRAIKKVFSSTPWSSEFCSVIVVTESAEGIWVHYIEGMYYSGVDFGPSIKWSKLLAGIHSYSANEYDSAVDVIPYPVGSDYNYLLIVGQPNGNTLMIKLDSNGNAIW